MPERKKRAAYFLLSGAYLGRPFDDGILKALYATGYAVDLFAPNPVVSNLPEYAATKILSIDYRLSWIRTHWRTDSLQGYDLFLGTPDLPMALVGALGGLTRKKTITLCDEVFTGGYAGAARSYWLSMAIYGMKHSAMTVITDMCRTELQRQLAHLSRDHKFVQYPCCFAENTFNNSPAFWREKLHLQEEDCLVSYTGGISAYTGLDWTLDALDGLPGRFKLLIQPVAVDTLLEYFLKRTALDRRIHFLWPPIPSYREAMSMNQAADIGIVIYTLERPQFQKMGVSSNKLCMFLQMGKPVVASRQPSFEFLEEYGAGILIDRGSELSGAILKIASDYPRYSRSARKCFEEYVNPQARLEGLTKALQAL